VRQILALPNCNTPEGLRDKAIMTLMAISGLRVVEVQRLRLQDYDASGEMGNGSLAVLGKGSKPRTVVLIIEIKFVLEQWLAARNLMKVDSDALFVTMRAAPTSAHGREMTTRSIRDAVDKYLERAGYKGDGISCHALRHSYGTISSMRGADLQVLSRSMGHDDTTTTQVYIDKVDAVKKNPSKLLADLL